MNELKEELEQLIKKLNGYIVDIGDRENIFIIGGKAIPDILEPFLADNFVSKEKYDSLTEVNIANRQSAIKAQMRAEELEQQILKKENKK